ncbi:ABC transporter permease [Nocardioides dongkuii]|uniref:ABC transporter permease n=1 Tax=Nocardioides dongkuii TaxID=2760089 RepID=UPI001C70A081|nr:ABC transporter permease [Nocardioides dongkuii]
MSDSRRLRGTTLSRARMATIGGGMVVGGIALAVLAVTVLSGALAALAVVAGLVLVVSGAGRLLWAARRRKVDLLPWLCFGWLVLLGVVAVLAPWLPFPEGRDATAALTEPIFLDPLKYGDHVLGTNGAGLDMLTRAVFGARTSLVISLTAIVIGIAVGGLVGVVAGFYRKGVDRSIGIVTNAVLAVPPLILLIALAAILAPNIRNMAFALAALTIPGMIRIARASTISFAQREFVLAAHAMGASRARIMLRELVPNVALPLFSMAVVTISALIVAEASLSFLGLGIAQPEPTWGNMIAEAQAGDTVEEHPFILLVPGVFLFLTVFSFNLLGEKAQRRWDPRSAKL